MAYRAADRQSQGTFNLWSGMVIAALAVGVFVLGLIFWSIIAYRRRHNDDGSLPRQTRENLPWEVAYTVVPIIIVAVIFYFTVVVENRVDALSPRPDVKVHVIAYRWGWIFLYQGTNVDIHTTSTAYPTLVLPEGETTQITLTSNDVVHEFMVPHFLFGRYAQPGIVNRFDFTPTQVGTFDGHCAVYCGLYHSEMLFYLRVVKPATFVSWLHHEEVLAG
jgi:cytochrome c oxidase subunit 2